jgi:organic radical activating enzyme
MLDAAVQQIPELRLVKTHDEHVCATGGKPLLYPAYVDLLMSAATRRDAEIRLPAQRSRRTINAAVTTPYSFDEANFYDVGYIDGGDSYFAWPDDATTGLMVNH